MRLLWGWRCLTFGVGVVWRVVWGRLRDVEDAIEVEKAAFARRFLAVVLVWVVVVD